MIAIFGKSLPENFIGQTAKVLSLLASKNVPFVCYEPLFQELSSHGMCIQCGSYTSHSDLPEETRLVLCMGGDGTMLETLTIVRDRKIPIVGINTGKLGFLSEIFPDEVESSLEKLLQNHFTLQPRNLIEVTSDDILIPTYNFALNDFTVKKNDQATLVRISVSVDGKFLNTYWADGLIISTATGSTAYSLSVGGPILVPESKGLILSPIASHNLTVRPLVVEKDSVIEVTIEGRDDFHVATFDNRNIQVPSRTKFKIRSANFTLNIAQSPEHHFFHTLRNKLMWGVDKRN
jgi:NAD+ kinase